MEALEKCAADEFRSANRQLEWMIAKVLMEEGRLKIKSPSDDEKENSKS
ncbi:MAG: DNA-binding protein [Bacteroidota bacterium]